MNFIFCMACYKMKNCYEGGKILCKSRGLVELPFFCFEMAEKKGTLLSPYSKVIWALENNGSEMMKRELKDYAGIEDAILDPILEKLAREDRIRITGDVISLNQ